VTYRLGSRSRGPMHRPALDQDGTKQNDMRVTGKIHHLQALRAIAASLVVADHALEYPIRRQLLGEHNYALAWMLGWVGVAVFFVISGLIMVCSSYDTFGDIQQARRFAVRRVLRVVPLYWLATSVFLVVSVVRTNAFNPVELVKSLLFVPYLSPGASGMRPMVGQGWTLNYEMMFYAIFALSLTLRRGLGLAWIFVVFVALVVCHVIFWPPFPYSDPVTPVQFWSDPIILLFALGMVIGLLEQSALRRRAVPHPIACSLILIVACGGAFIALGGAFPLPMSWQILFAAMAVCTVYICTNAVTAAPGRVEQVLETAGDASYSTYLIHPLVLMVFATVWGLLPRSMQHPMAFLIASILLCNLTGYLVHLSIERPLGEKLRHFAERPRDLPKRARLLA
jgi:exopolysaccharide production protein ExoZ